MTEEKKDSSQPTKPTFFSEYKPLIVFLSKALAIYLCWIVINAFWLGKNGALDRGLRNSETYLCSSALTAMGFDISYRVKNKKDVIALNNETLIRIANSCNGLILFVIFGGFIICYPDGWKKKLWYIPLGVVLIYLINVIRIISLSLIKIYFPEYLEFNHHYVFTVVVYGFIFLLWVFYINKVSSRKLTLSSTDND